MTEQTETPTIAYLTGDYPKVSHTFIQREVAALRDLGLDIRTCSIRRPPAHEVAGDAEQAELAQTFYVLSQAKHPLRLIGAHLGALRRNPRGWARALGLAWRTRSPGVKAALWQMFYFLEAGVLADHLHRICARHLHNHFMDSSCSVAMLASEMNGTPFSFTLHGPTELYEPHRWRLDEKIARSAFSAYISHFARSQGMLFSDRSHWNRMRIVHCGIQPERYAGPRVSPPGKTMVFIGRMSGVKGAPLMIEALAALLPQHPDARLVMVGDGPERPALESQARTLGVDAAVAFTGTQTQDQVAAHLAKADLLALPSFAEGVPVVLMEAMAAGLPVVTTRIAGIGELVEDGASGYLVPPGDLDSLVARLDALLSDPELRDRMGQVGRDKVRADYAITSEAAWLADLFRGSLASDLPPTLRPPVAS
ncbi:MAG: glycosyltransferase family 4 protein [Paracoccus sp. (in: a-proteobacteria)]|uniref:glycosyltransferase family 4 protein n=1 Tax=Paracoccus sp. TaxID=267 RepID=UPI0026DEC847|nr:glycosyltransferase family 4 protein [Paracoccus sp. (in: a-proteobacteria)]MDO5631049.1 glycosyltransferase family 4 protein [Paracoccus sp. (in: a-proteobacteria)]